jgi:arylsulfatase A-like enzyme
LKHWLQDEAIGAIVAKLKDVGHYENTVIVMLGDNGSPAQGGRSKTSYDRRTKNLRTISDAQQNDIQHNGFFEILSPMDL